MAPRRRSQKPFALEEGRIRLSDLLWLVSYKLERDARDSDDIEAWHEIVGRPDAFEEPGEILTRDQLDARPVPDGVTHSVVEYVDGQK